MPQDSYNKYMEHKKGVFPAVKTVKVQQLNINDAKNINNSNYPAGNEEGKKKPDTAKPVSPPPPPPANDSSEDNNLAQDLRGINEHLNEVIENTAARSNLLNRDINVDGAENIIANESDIQIQNQEEYDSKNFPPSNQPHSPSLTLPTVSENSLILPNVPPHSFSLVSDDGGENLSLPSVPTHSFSTLANTSMQQQRQEPDGRDISSQLASMSTENLTNSMENRIGGLMQILTDYEEAEKNNESKMSTSTDPTINETMSTFLQTPEPQLIDEFEKSDSIPSTSVDSSGLLFNPETIPVNYSSKTDSSENVSWPSISQSVNELPQRIQDQLNSSSSTSSTSLHAADSELNSETGSQAALELSIINLPTTAENSIVSIKKARPVPYLIPEGGPGTIKKIKPLAVSTPKYTIRKKVRGEDIAKNYKANKDKPQEILTPPKSKKAPKRKAEAISPKTRSKKKLQKNNKLTVQLGFSEADIIDLKKKLKRKARPKKQDVPKPKLLKQNNKKRGREESPIRKNKIATRKLKQIKVAEELEKKKDKNDSIA